MANNNQIELVVTVEVDKANQSIKSVNANLSSIETAATKSARAAASRHRRHDGFDGQGRHGRQPARGRDQERASRGPRNGPSVRRWRRRTTQSWRQSHAHSRQGARRRCRRSRAGHRRHPEGWVQHRTTRPPACRSSSSRMSVWTRPPGLAKIAKDAAAVNTEGLDAAQAFEKLMLAIETGQSRGLRTMSLFPELARGRGDRAAGGSTARQDALRT